MVSPGRSQDQKSGLKDRKSLAARQKRRRGGRSRLSVTSSGRRRGLQCAILSAVVALLLLVVCSAMLLAVDVNKKLWTIDDDWHASLVWLRENTPEPFGDADFYYAKYEPPPQGKDYDYPASSYGVMSWADYGHWITTIARRIPNSSPLQAGLKPTGSFFTAQDEPSADEILDKLGSKYVIMDWSIALQRFGVLAVAAGKDPRDFSEVYYQRNQNGVFAPVTVFYPEYYRSMYIRLYFFKGRAATPDESTLVISYRQHGNGLKEITSTQLFATYEEALDYMEGQSSPTSRIVGFDPSLSPVPLERLDHYSLVYQSPSTILQLADERISYVEIFEYGTP
ncbi:hypothetical protein ACFLWH_00735 [Chloroflexota bacterium]